MADTSDNGVFEVMEIDDDEAAADLMIFAEDQQDQSELSLDIDLRKPYSHHHQQQMPKSRKQCKSRIEVVVRKRPMNGKEFENGESDVVNVESDDSKVTICEPRLKVDLTKFTQFHEFKFDHSFGENASNTDIYEMCVKPLFDTILRVPRNAKFAGKATCFGYGQTGSGKTYTLLGSMDENTGQYVEGLYAMAVRDLFKYLPANNEIVVSFYEIYGGKLFDLLADRKQIVCREDGKQKVNIVGLKRIKCGNAESLMEFISAGNAMRQIGSTGANNTSSRSHAILSMDILPIRGKLSFIDLAGSERGRDTQNNDKQTRMEGAQINQSLLALKECIRALDMGSIHKPFRGSKLTQVLKESFMGNSRTLMIANISPNSGSCENTLNTLRYAYRVKELKNDAPSGIDDVSQKALARNRSEPSLPIYKSQSRPATARKREQHKHRHKNLKLPDNQNSNNSNTRKAKSGNNSEYGGKSRSRESSRPKKRKLLQPAPPAAAVESAEVRQSHRNVRSRQNNSNERNKSSSSSEHGEIANLRNVSARRKRNKKPSPPTSVKGSDDVVMMNDKQENSKKTTFTKKQLVKAHRRHIDEFMILIKEDMQLLKSFDKDEFEQTLYQHKLREILQKQADAVQKYKSKIFQ
eukprot:CAMPEP_0197025096 /NCGR_PEP_ID=MMETSP1384-20130603/5529_1 /TAXON_ID=29189 /ORGANISM="Ammonia sp." /LENGTH=635 /DNA_ID=CAMNT_0042453587 /DNA_START=67 /DNA_END=1974 /DNA_ORIENTATION=-